LRPTRAAPQLTLASRALPPGADLVGYPTPYLWCDGAVAGEKYGQFRLQLPEVDVFYAVKANSDRHLLSLFRRQGASFEVASPHELELVANVGADPADVLYSNTVKAAWHIATAYERGLYRFAFDSEAELRKLARHAPGSSVYVRLVVDDSHSIFPLSRKFGTSSQEAARLLLLARELRLEPYGVTFHVGSQCTDPTAWQRAIGRCSVLLATLQRAGIRLKMVNIGGGFPAHYTSRVPSLAEIAILTRQALARLPYQPDLVAAEPGRFLVAQAGVLVASVIGVDRRPDGPWVYLDVGGYNGLMEALQTGGRWPFPLLTTADERCPDRARFTVTGPTCDPSDTMFYHVPLPTDIEEGDVIRIGCAGAYAISYASHFNGFPPPPVLFHRSNVA
jgi:ornithine decarboxylase